MQQRKVRVDRSCRVQRVQHDQLARGVREVILTAHDMGYSHVLVVNGDGEVVERRAIGSSDDEVVEEPVLECRAAADHVLHDGLTVVGNAEAHGGSRCSLRDGTSPISGATSPLLRVSEVIRGGDVPVGSPRLEQVIQPLCI
jgi:hypothetical protein